LFEHLNVYLVFIPRNIPNLYGASRIYAFLFLESREEYQKLLNSEMKEDEIGGAGSTNGRDEKFIQYFGRKT